MAAFQSSIEILVHTSAFCKASEDKKYRHQARSILSFLNERHLAYLRSEPEASGTHAKSSSDSKRSRHKESFQKPALPAHLDQSSSFISSSSASQEGQKVQVVHTPFQPPVEDHYQFSQRPSTVSFEQLLAVKETPLVIVARTPYAEAPLIQNRQAYATTRMPEREFHTPADPVSPRTPPSTIPESAALDSELATASRKRKFFSQNSQEQPHIEDSFSGIKRPRIEDANVRWPNEFNSSPSLRRRSPLRIIRERNVSPSKRPIVAPIPSSISVEKLADLPQSSAQSIASVGSSKAAAPISSDSNNTVLNRKTPQQPNQKPTNSQKSPAQPTRSRKASKRVPHTPRASKVLPKYSPLTPVHKKGLKSKGENSEDLILSPFRTLHAPLPKTDEVEFTTHKVQMLADASITKKLAKYYRPLEVTREIQPLERGYWRFRLPEGWTEKWTSKERDELHEYIAKMTQEGRAGWGTWVEPVLVPTNTVVQFESPDSEVVDGLQGPVKARSMAMQPKPRVLSAHRNQVELRFWCWGEVVKEVWLALFLRGHHYMTGWGTTWVDSGGKTVVRME